MMLASPFLPSAMFSTQPSPDESLHYRPSKDLETFNSLLPPPIEFIEGSSSGTLAVAEGKYEPINASPKIVKAELHESLKPPPPSPTPNPAKSTTKLARPTSAKTTSLYPDAIDLTWPQTCTRGTGLYNSGNTCFLNSALQCMLHTPPLLRLVLAHTKEKCRVDTGFCMSCGLRQVAVKAYTGKATFSPAPVSNHLQTIAKHMRKGRQEDTHEFLRYAIDALQKSCLVGQPPKLDAKVAETTWVHKVFGGRLRSRVTCRDCGHNSDTFDRILDLSLDIFRCDSLKDALKKFVAIDYLKGADKYKCEKCKKHVNAEKRFTIHEAPPVLTVHLKRFSPLGRKISHLLQYEEELSLQPYMSVGSFGPSYSLYGVICHAGGGPNSGHYYAFVKSREGRWFEMNDESVSGTSVPKDKKNAYMLFYIQNKGQGLEAAVQAPLNGVNGPPMKNGLAAAMKKKTQRSKDADDEDKGVKVESNFIGPLLPSAEITGSKAGSAGLDASDPQATSLKSKIAAVAKQANQALASLGNYDSDKDSEASTPPQSSQRENENEPMDIDVKGKRKDDSERADEPLEPPSSSPTLPPSSSQPSAPRTTVPPASFYAPINKRKSPDTLSGNQSPRKKISTPLQSRTTGYSASNPYNRPIPKRKRMGI